MPNGKFKFMRIPITEDELRELQKRIKIVPDIFEVVTKEDMAKKMEADLKTRIMQGKELAPPESTYAIQKKWLPEPEKPIPESEKIKEKQLMQSRINKFVADSLLQQVRLGKELKPEEMRFLELMGKRLKEPEKEPDYKEKIGGLADEYIKTSLSPKGYDALLLPEVQEALDIKKQKIIEEIKKTKEEFKADSIKAATMRDYGYTDEEYETVRNELIKMFRDPKAVSDYLMEKGITFDQLVEFARKFNAIK